MEMACYLESLTTASARASAITASSSVGIIATTTRLLAVLNTTG
jgi:hypothetical protein